LDGSSIIIVIIAGDDDDDDDDGGGGGARTSRSGERARTAGGTTHDNVNAMIAEAGK
jgi:hypothetical protein